MGRQEPSRGPSLRKSILAQTYVLYQCSERDPSFLRSLVPTSSCDSVKHRIQR